MGELATGTDIPVTAAASVPSSFTSTKALCSTRAMNRSRWPVMPEKSAEAAAALLEKLKDRIEAASYAEVIRNALRVFEALVEEHEKGSEFSPKRADGEIVQYKIFV